MNEISEVNFQLQENNCYQTTLGVSRCASDYRGIKNEEITQRKTKNQKRLRVLAFASLIILLIFVVFVCFVVAFVEIANLKSEIAHLSSAPANNVQNF